MMKYYLVDSDNYGGDYPNEKFVKEAHTRDFITADEEGEALAFDSFDKAQEVACRINTFWGEFHGRYLKVVREGYKLQPGFEP